jgi:hypothetical protein
MAQARAYHAIAQSLDDYDETKPPASQIGQRLSLQFDWELGRLQSNFGDLRKRSEIAEKAILAATRGLQRRLWRSSDTSVVLESLGQSLETFQSAGDFKSVDKILLLKGKWRKQAIAAGRFGRLQPIYGLSALSELAWGFGARPLRLIPFACLIIISFALIYFGEWSLFLPRALPAAKLFEDCLLLSLRYFVPGKLFEHAGLSRLPFPQLLFPLQLTARVESLIGLGVSTVAGSSLIRWAKRSLSTTEKD